VFCEAGDPRWSSAGLRLAKGPADFLLMPPCAALRGSPILRGWTPRKPKRLSGAAVLDQKIALRRNRTMNSAEVWFFGHIREGANQAARAFPHSATRF
jgi:hypothetical protein